MVTTATPGFASQQEVYAALIRQGADANLAAILAAITRPESSGFTAANNGTYLGLFQIGNYHGFDNARLLSNDIDYQAQAALQVYHQQGLAAWETHTNGSYQKYLNPQNSPALAAQPDLSNFSDIGSHPSVQARQAAPLTPGAILGSPGGAGQPNLLDSPTGSTSAGDVLASPTGLPSGA